MPLFSYLYDLFMYPQDRLGLWKLRRKTVGPAEGCVLEVGVGSGLNFDYYERATELIGIDPDPVLLKRAARRARRRSLPIRLEAGDAQRLPFADDSFDTVVSMLVFCTVSDAGRGLREIRRVLRPEGRVRLLEHVRSENPRMGRFQDFILPVWRRVFGGCHPNRDTVARLKESGFELTEFKRYKGVMVMTGRKHPEGHNGRNND